MYSLSELQDTVKKKDCCNGEPFGEASGCMLSLTEFISKCLENVTTIWNITTHANKKPWLTKEVHARVIARNAAFKSREKDALRSSRANFNQGVRAAKPDYGHKIQSH